MEDLNLSYDDEDSHDDSRGFSEIQPSNRGHYPVFLGWSLKSSRSLDRKLDPADVWMEKLNDPKRMSFFYAVMNNLVKENKPDLGYRLAQLLVRKTKLKEDDPVFNQLQAYLKEKGIKMVLIPYVGSEGHA
jgi:hypothetical protein